MPGSLGLAESAPLIDTWATPAPIPMYGRMASEYGVSKVKMALAINAPTVVGTVTYCMPRNLGMTGISPVGECLPIYTPSSSAAGRIDHSEPSFRPDHS